MEDGKNTLYSWDIQEEVYLEGQDKLDVPLDSKNYNFEFDRFYAIHEDETKKYNFVAILNDDVVQKEAAAGRPITKTVSDYKNVDFKWDKANEVWHIEMSKENYDKISYKIYTADNEGNLTNPNCTIYTSESGIVDYYGRNRIYFINDMGLNIASRLDNLDTIEEEEISTINNVILGIRNLIPKIEEIGITKNEMRKVGFYPERYEVKSNG